LNTSHPRTNLVRRVSHARPVVVLEDAAANESGFIARLEEIGAMVNAQLAKLPTPAHRLPPTPRAILDKKLAAVTIARARAARTHGDGLPFWTLINYAEALLRSALSHHVRAKHNTH
jgi:hypothetical protein